MLEILVEAFLEHRAEGVPYPCESVRLLVAKPLQLRQHPSGHTFADRSQKRTFLNLLAGNVERQISTVHQTAHEAEIPRQDIRLVGDENAFDVELDAAFAILIEQVERPRTWNEQQCRVVLPPLRAIMDRSGRFVELTGDAAVEVGVIARSDFGLRLG